MMEVALVRYIHLLGVIVLFSLLVVEHVKLKTNLTPEQLKRLVIVDLCYGISAIIVLLAGISLWVGVGKPAEFYTGNPIFHAKFGLFLLLALLSVYPTIKLLKLRRSEAAVIEIPRSLVFFVRVELLLFIAIPLLAVLMAQGIGLGAGTAP